MLRDGWTRIGPATFARDDGWLVSVDDSDGSVLAPRGDDRPWSFVLSPAEVMRLVDETTPRTLTEPATA